ncbi:DUF6746 family protein [Marinospirillum sp.]|uniref:DUF6746 family protein n=1 Tax=Marinospirillum sp. TaxID=2183934 RepID=UPI003A85E07C
MKYLIAACALLFVATAAQADRPDHFRGLPADTLQEAVQNFSEYNQRLAAVLENRNLGRAQMAEVHQLTYTLENALEKIQAEVNALVDTLEELHIASEGTDARDMQRKGRVYLETATQIVR